MCYLPNLRSRTCRFGPVEAERKLVRRCVFCGRRQPYNASYRAKWHTPQLCPALTKPGHLVVAPDLPVEQTHDYHGLIVGLDPHHRVVELWVPEHDQTPTATRPGG